MDQRTDIKVAVLFELIYRFNTMLIKIPAGIFAEIEKPTLKLTWKCKGSRTAKTSILKKKNKVRTLTLPYFKTSNKASGIKTVWYWHRDRHKLM